MIIVNPILVYIVKSLFEDESKTKSWKTKHFAKGKYGSGINSDLCRQMKNFDNSFLTDRIKLIAGTDEAGRGPLAGPVVAAAVIFSPDTFIENVNDSKKLTEKEREELYPIIIEKSLSYGISIISNVKIDKINILQASLLAMKRSVNKLQVKPDLILIDGNKTFHT